MGEIDDDLEDAGTGAPAPAAAPVVAPVASFETLDRTLDRLDFMDALDDLASGGDVGFATGIEIIGEQLAHGPHDALLDAFEPARDLADHTDLLDDIF